jgi:phosphatidylglycerol lysyltransferase
MSAAIFAAYILLPADITPTFWHFSLFYIASALIGIASHAPGGIGVFEAGMMTALAANGRADVLAALLLYRVIYNLTPFCFACISVAVHTLRRSQLDNG